ncbi:MAG TPA: hypothetical protein VHL53_20585 [Acidimicrobiia bacterium]|nr:hypothetical protein [Acidimicrobiia bacterium]
MLTDDGLASLRMAASLALTLPTVRVRIASPSRGLAEVGWQLEGPSPDGVRLRPCAFRLAVGRAWRQRREGLDVDFCGLGDHRPAITVSVGEEERILPGDIYQVRAESGGWHHVLATLLPPEGCHAVLGLEGPPLAFHDDPVTGVTLVHTQTDHPDPDRFPHLAHHLTALRGRLLAEELIADPMVVRSPER